MSIESAAVSGIEYVGQATFPVAPELDGTLIGGLSGIVYDADTGRYLAISDDRSQFDPARIYTLEIDLADGSLSDGDVTFTDVTTLLLEDGTPFPALSIDSEGIALTEAGIYISSEGDATVGLSPFVNLFDLSGQQIGTLPIDGKYAPTGTSGIRNNLAFESLTVSPDGSSLYVATENALVQDGPAASLGAGSPSRIVQYDLASGTATAEFIYVTDPVAEAPTGPAPFSTNGLVELLAIDDAGTFLAIERSFSTGGAGGAGTGNTIRIYEVRTQGATNVIGEESAQDALASGAVAAAKTLLLDLSDLGVPLDNIEGVSFGPPLEDGRQSLILVSDNNFSATAFTQFLAFAIDLDRTVATEASAELLSAAGGDTVFLFDNSETTGRDRIDDFGSDDLLLTTVALFDSNNDGTIGFGDDRRLDMSTGNNEVTMFGEDGGRITSLDFDGITTVDGIDYYTYSLADAGLPG